MDFIEIDKNKCNQDGLCVASCPSRLLEIGEDGCPVTVEGAETMCIRCGHCVSVCPTGALKHSKLDFHRFEIFDEGFRMTGEQCENFFKTRRSIRAYKDKPVSGDKLSRLIDIARYAPTARNAQDVSWLVVTDRTELKRYSSLVIDFNEVVLKGDIQGIKPNPHMKKLIDDFRAGNDMILRDAPVLIITHGNRENRLAQIDCIIAAAYLEMAANGLGLGCCWAGFFMTAAANYQPLMDALALPEKHQAFGAIMAGYPRFKYQRIPIRRQPKIIWR
ncbi:MAG: nitroreductase family protein [Deltaproteobacteria bacterium]|nr:nitroreductase family protein [Deltaproteobacteria bacterium]